MSIYRIVRDFMCVGSRNLDGKLAYELWRPDLYPLHLCDVDSLSQDLVKVELDLARLCSSWHTLVGAKESWHPGKACHNAVVQLGIRIRLGSSRDASERSLKRTQTTLQWFQHGFRVALSSNALDETIRRDTHLSTEACTTAHVCGGLRFCEVKSSPLLGRVRLIGTSLLCRRGFFSNAVECVDSHNGSVAAAWAVVSATRSVHDVTAKVIRVDRHRHILLTLAGILIAGASDDLSVLRDSDGASSLCVSLELGSVLVGYQQRHTGIALAI